MKEAFPCQACGIFIGEGYLFTYCREVGSLKLCPSCYRDLQKFGYLFPGGLERTTSVVVDGKKVSAVLAIDKEGNKVALTPNQALAIINRAFGKPEKTIPEIPSGFLGKGRRNHD